MSINFEGYDALLIPSWDKFASEVVPKPQNLLLNLTGFSGSLGVAVIGKVNQAFFTDGRYTLQAKKELPSDYTHYNFSLPTIGAYLSKHYKGKIIGFDPWIIRYNQFESIAKAADSVTLKPINKPLKDLPNPPLGHLLLLTDSDAGESFKSKRQRIFDLCGADSVFLHNSDDISWLLNARINRSDDPSLALKGFMLLHSNGTDTLYVENPDAYNGVDCKIASLDQLTNDIKQTDDSLYIDSNAPYIVAEAVGFNLEEEDKIGLLKCIKNETEIANIKHAHMIDGKILAKFLDDLNDIYQDHTEYSLGELLTHKRSEHPSYISDSFASIVGYGENGAIVHYRADKAESLAISDQKLLLIDSGAHYKWGTTDVTRTIKLGEPNQKEKQLFTAVLKGMIDVFLYEWEDATGKEIDAIARKPLNDSGYDFAHSTGHGVGYALNVHEGPIRLSSAYDLPILPGMVLSIEPGVYLDNEFGIRIENLAVVRERDGLKYFETLTRVPIQKSLIDFDALSEEERKWLDQQLENK